MCRARELWLHAIALGAIAGLAVAQQWLAAAAVLSAWIVWTAALARAKRRTG